MTFKDDLAVVRKTLLASGNQDCRLTPDVPCPECDALAALDRIEWEYDDLLLDLAGEDA